MELIGTFTFWELLGMFIIFTAATIGGTIGLRK